MNDNSLPTNPIPEAEDIAPREPVTPDTEPTCPATAPSDGGTIPCQEMEPTPLPDDAPIPKEAPSLSPPSPTEEEPMDVQAKEPALKPAPPIPPTPVWQKVPPLPQRGTPVPPRPTYEPTPYPYEMPAADSRMPNYDVPYPPYPPQSPYAPQEQVPFERGNYYPPQQGAPSPQGRPYPPQQGAPSPQNRPYPPQQGAPSPQGRPYPNSGYPQPPNRRTPSNPGYPPYGAPGYGPGYGNYSPPPRNNNPGTVPPKQPPESPSSGASNNQPKHTPPVWMLVLLIAGCIFIGTISGLLISNITRSMREAAETSDTVSNSSSAPGSTGPQQPAESRPSVTQPSTFVPRETQPLATASGEQLTLNQIYSQNVPAIVGILNESTQTVFGQTSTASSAGSGFIISSDGEILTNYHVVQGASTLTVSLYDGRRYPATLIGYEAESDIALIKIEAENLPVCAIGNSDYVYVGEQIAAIGNPMGELTYTMTVGYVSALNRFVNTDGTPINMIQVDAAINPGNSGGPVFNLYGEVIGIATAKYSGTLSDGATLEGLGFAIPINDIVEILNDLRVNGKVPDRAYMGVMVSMLALDEATYGIDHGVYVESVENGSSAAKAGVQAKDIIIKIGDVDINAYENLQQTLRGYRAGDETTITVYRNGQTVTLPIVFDSKPETTETIVPEETTIPEGTESPWETFPWGDFPWSDFGG